MSDRRIERRRQEILNTIPIFLSKTYRIVDNPEYWNIISWAKDQASFVVKNISKLTNEVFPKHFKHTNFLSFIRQLNMYGFKKMRGEEQGPIFHHECFQKKNIQLLLQIKKKNLPATEQQGEDLIVAVSSREELLQKQICILKQQHQELQNMVQILMDQNKSITAQNKTFISMMAQMKQKHRKKLETLMLLFLFGKKPKAEDGEFLFPSQFENMIEAFQQLKNGQNPLILVPQTTQRKRNSLKMLTGQPHFYSDIEHSQNGSQAEHNEKEDIFKSMLNEGDQEHKLEKSKDNPKLISFEEKSFSQDHHEVPLSPLSSIISRGNNRKIKQSQWDDYLDRLNHSDYSELELERQN